MREHLLKYIFHGIKEIIPININKKSILIALYLFITTILCYAIKYILSLILPNYYKNPDYIFSIILDPHSLFLYCAIASAATMLALLINILKGPDFIRFGITEYDVILPVLSLFYLLLIMSVISSFFDYHDCIYILTYLCVILTINLPIIIYRYFKRELIGKALLKYERNLTIIGLLILSILTVIFCLRDVNISSSCS